MTGRRHRGRPRRAARLAAVTAATAVTAVVLGGRPAAADPPAPTDFRSLVDAVTPAGAGVEAEVVGGDAFLRLRVTGDHEVVVPGYAGEPYLRFGPDGTVERNRRSPATYVNQDRQGGGEAPAEADPEAEPAWDEVGGDGSYAWHDHRIHWMQPGDPPVDRGEVVQEWTVDLTVDGAPARVEGRLIWVEPANPWPWAVLATVVAAAVVLVGWRRTGRGSLVGAAAVTVAALGALAVGWGQYADAPAGAGTSPLVVAVPAAALVAGLAAVGLWWRSRSLAAAAALAAVAASTGWAALRLPVLWKAVLPTGLPFAVDRAGTALALGLAVAAAALVVHSGDLALGPGRPPPTALPAEPHSPADTGAGD